jgi:hypothetical protein
MSTIAKKAMQFYVQNRDATIDPTALHLLPSKNPQHHLRRDNKIMVLHRQGLKSSQIAGDVGISPARVRQIIRANTPKPESFKVKSLPPAEFDVHEWDAHLPPARRRKA